MAARRGAGAGRLTGRVRAGALGAGAGATTRVGTLRTLGVGARDVGRAWRRTSCAASRLLRTARGACRRPWSAAARRGLAPALALALRLGAGRAAVAAGRARAPAIATLRAIGAASPLGYSPAATTSPVAAPPAMPAPARTAQAMRAMPAGC